MLSFAIMILGLGLVIWSLYSIRRDIETGNLELTKGLSGVSDRNLEKIIYYLDELEKQMNDMNAAFYDLVADLEGSYSVHDKEISLLTARIEQLEGKRTEGSNLVSRDKLDIEPEVEKFSEEAIPLPSLEVQEAVDVKSGTMGLTPEEAHIMKQRIFALRKEGHSLSQIAKILNVGLGELQLFIKLNTK